MATVSAYTTASGERRYRVRYRTPERRQTDKRGFRRKADAMAFAATVEVSKSTGAYIPASAGRVTVGELGRAWLRRREAVMRPKTHYADMQMWKAHVLPRWGGVAVGDVRRTAVASWVAELSGGGLGASGVRQAVGVLRGVLDDAVSDRQIVVNPARGLDLPEEVERERVYLDAGQLSRLVACAGEAGGVLAFLGWTGLRFGEASALRVGCVDMMRRRVRVVRTASDVGGMIVEGEPKTVKGRRSVPFPEFLAPMVGQAVAGKGPDGLVFTSPEGKQLRGGNVRKRVLVPAQREAGSVVERVQAAVGVATAHRGPLFDRETVDAVTWWQLRHGLEASGRVDRPTWEALARLEGLTGRFLPVGEGARDFGPLTLHDLRHTAASLAISAGANVKAVQAMLGHKSAAMTLDTYADLFPDDLDAVASALDDMSRSAFTDVVGKVWARGLQVVA